MLKAGACSRGDWGGGGKLRTRKGRRLRGRGSVCSSPPLCSPGGRPLPTGSCAAAGQKDRVLKARGRAGSPRAELGRDAFGIWSPDRSGGAEVTTGWKWSGDSGLPSVSPVPEGPRGSHGWARTRFFAFGGRGSSHTVKTRKVWAKIKFLMLKILLKFLTKFSLAFILNPVNHF